MKIPKIDTIKYSDEEKLDILAKSMKNGEILMKIFEKLNWTEGQSVNAIMFLFVSLLKAGSIDTEDLDMFFQTIIQLYENIKEDV